MEMNNELIETVVYHTIADYQLDLTIEILYGLLGKEPEIKEQIDEIEEIRLKLFKAARVSVKNIKKKEEDLF